jgi:hypothetical protein
MSRPRKITDDKLPRLIQVVSARLKAEAMVAEVPVNKQLAHEVGVTPGYMHNVMHRLTAIMRTGKRVPHETLQRALYNDKEFILLIERLGRRSMAKSKVNVITLTASGVEAHSPE